MSLSNNPTQQTPRTKDDIPALKIKAAELERQANEFKTKLDELRRAKATTVLKYEKEYVNTTVPGTNRPEKIKCEKCEEFEELIENEKKSNKDLKKQSELKETNKKQSQQSTTNCGPCSRCPNSQELLDNQKENNLDVTQQLMSQEQQTEQERNAKEMLERSLAMTQSQLIEAKHRCEKIQKENQEYQNECERMKKEHADKMAELCRQEEEAKNQITTWEQMYREWMATMEKRVSNLQVNNQELNTYIRDDHQMSQQRRSGGNGNQRR